ncbi:MAG: hypothetical protein ACFFBL_11215 [Promethearchaeota archaeon]
MDAVVNLMKGYYSDKKAHPWHSIYKNLEKNWTREHPKRDIQETLILLRDAVFGALDILSLSIALDVPTSEFVTILANEASWQEGRRKVRNICIEHVENLVKKRKTRYLVPSALKRDGFGFLIDEIEEAEVETFRKAKPKMRKVPKKKKQVLNLRPLEKSRLGSQFLKEQRIMETEIEKGDSRIPEILEAYDHFLVELEIDLSSTLPEPVPTEQITLNGTPILDVDKEKAVPSKRSRKKIEQPPLTDFIEKKPKSKKKKPKKPSGRKKRRAKKK